MGLTLFALLNGNGNSGWPAALLYLHQGLFTGEMLRVLKALGLNCIEENLRQQGIPEVRRAALLCSFQAALTCRFTGCDLNPWSSVSYVV